jgi:hypothetical protein
MAEEPEDQDIEFGSREPGTKPWFKFWANRWLGSDTVDSMTMTEQGIFLRILCGVHTYGSLTRDAWKLSKRLNIPYRPLLSWMTKYGHLGDIIHEEGCDFATAQPLPFHSAEAVRKQCGDSTETLPKQCRDSSWTVPNFEKLQCLSKKSTPDIVGDKKRVEQSRLDLCSATRKSKNKSPKSKPASLAKHDANVSRKLRDSGCCERCDTRWPGDPMPHCGKCSGRGSYTELGTGVVPCECGEED